MTTNATSDAVNRVAEVASNSFTRLDSAAEFKDRDKPGCDIVTAMTVQSDILTATSISPCSVAATTRY